MKTLVSCGFAASLALIFGCACDDESLNRTVPPSGDAAADAGREASADSGADAGTESGADAGPDAADAEAGPLEPFVEHGGGTPLSITIHDNHAFAAVGPRVVIWDISNTAQPRIVGQTDPLPGFVTEIAIADDVAYVAESRATGLDGDVHYYDVSNPAAPSYGGVLNYLAPAKQPRALLVDGNVLYVADTESGVHWFDITDRRYPVFQNFVEAPGASALELGQDRLLVFASGLGLGITAYDTSTPGQLTEAGGWQFFVTSALDATVYDQTAYVMDVEGLYVFRLAAEPEELSFDPSIRSRSITRIGSNVYIAAEDGVYSFDAAAATVTGGLRLELPTHRTVAIAGAANTLLSMGEDGFGHVFDVPAPATVTHAAAFDLPVAVAPKAVAARDELLYISDLNTGLRIVNARTLATVGRVDRLRNDPDFGPIAVFEDIALSGNHVYMPNWVGDVVVVDVSDPAQPTIESSFDLTGYYPSAIAAVDQWVYVADSTNEGLFRILDASDPKNLVLKGSLPVAHTVKLVARERLVIAADQASADETAPVGGVLLIDVTNPDQPQLASRYTQDCASPGGVALEGNLVAATCEGSSLHLIDIATPSAPRRLSRHQLAIGSGYAVLLRADRAYVADDHGISVVDIGDPTRPRTLGHAPVTFTAYHMAFSGSGRLIAPTGLAGVYNLDLSAGF